MNESISGNNPLFESVSSNNAMEGESTNGGNILADSVSGNDDALWINQGTVTDCQTEQLQVTEAIRTDVGILCSELSALLFGTLFIWIERKLRNAVHRVVDRKGGNSNE